MSTLRSKLFKSDARLAACLVDNAKHVTQGDSGPHVARIQYAILMLTGGTISGGELNGKLYGKTTAIAVLAYKTRRGIINAKYQKTADDIVGIMTLRALDDEMFDSEVRDRSAQINI